MRALSVILVLAFCILQGCLCVEVRYGEKSYPLEAVKLLKELMDVDADVNPLLANKSTFAVCANPTLPQAFVPVCQSDEAAIVFATLANLISPPDPCEICANPSCFGCL